MSSDGGVRPLEATECMWCGAPFPGASARYVVCYDPHGNQYEERIVCDNCNRKGPPFSSRRQRIEWAWKIEPQMSRLERLGWWLIRWGQR